MNEILINTKEIESVWKKNNIYFVKTKTGKVWLCEPQVRADEYRTINDIRNNNYQTIYMSTMKYIQLKWTEKHESLITLNLIKKGKSENNG